MKTVGLIGGISWQSTVEYYRLINQGVNARLGGNHSAKILMASVDFHDVEKGQIEGGWQALEVMMAGLAHRLEEAGADFIAICANTMHRTTTAVEATVKIPLVHIADATAKSIKAMGLTRVGLLGTKFTMSEPFYRDRLKDLHGIEALSPDPDDQELVHKIIHKELVKGEIHPGSRAEYLGVMHKLAARGAEGVILGCTEIPLLIRQSDTAIPVFDTTALHSAAIVDYALA